MSDMQNRMPAETPQSGRDVPARDLPDRDVPAREMSTSSRTLHESDMASHPDILEMRERHARMLESPRVSMVEGLILLTGAYTAISPWIVHFQTSNSIMTVNNLVLGLTLAALGAGMTVRPELMLRLGWTVSAIGVWLIVSPWVASLGHHATRSLIWNNAFVGGLAVVLGLGAMGVLRSGAGEAGRPGVEHRESRRMMRHG
jgi:hypothetical protein